MYHYWWFCWYIWFIFIFILIHFHSSKHIIIIIIIIIILWWWRLSRSRLLFLKFSKHSQLNPLCIMANENKPNVAAFYCKFCCVQVSDSLIVVNGGGTAYEIGKLCPEYCPRSENSHEFVQFYSELSGTT